jgi:hypothetical protein
MNKYLLAAALCVASTASQADNTDRGRWFCDTCMLRDFSQAGQGLVAGAASEIVQFIKGTVNRTMPASGWQTWDRVQVCDGNVCVQMRYYLGNWYFEVNRPDKGGAYKNAPTGSSRWEYPDYYGFPFTAWTGTQNREWRYIYDYEPYVGYVFAGPLTVVNGPIEVHNYGFNGNLNIIYGIGDNANINNY